MNISSSISRSAKLSSTGQGFVAATTAFAMWGLLPWYLKQVGTVPASQITAHRVTWGCLFTIGFLAACRELPNLRAVFRNRAVCLRLLLSACCISCNWLLFAWGVTHGRVVESSLGYFINPLFNVLLGVVILSERLTRVQWTAVAVAAMGVGYLAWMVGDVPWLALGLALSFGVYGLVRKVTPVDSLLGFAVETLIITPVACAFLIWCHIDGQGAFEQASSRVQALLAAGGVLTAIPLVLFAFGARRLPYSTVGLLQYIAPTLQLLLGVWVYHEPFSGPRVTGFALIWLALLIFAGDGFFRGRSARSAITSANS